MKSVPEVGTQREHMALDAQKQIEMEQPIPQSETLAQPERNRKRAAKRENTVFLCLLFIIVALVVARVVFGYFLP